MYRVSKNMIKQMVFGVEWKHIFGFLFNEDGPIPLEKEIAIFERVQALIQTRFPLFQMKIIASGLKVLGKWHIQAQIDAVFAARKLTNMCIGFDMVNEEDFTPEIDFFMP